MKYFKICVVILLGSGVIWMGYMKIIEGKGHKYWAKKMDSCVTARENIFSNCMNGKNAVAGYCTDYDVENYGLCENNNPEPSWKNKYYKWNWVDLVRY